MRKIGCVLFLLLLTAFPAQANTDIKSGKGSFRFTEWPVAPLTVWYTLPSKASSDTPVVFVMHGLRRNGKDYRDQWSDLAKKYKFLLLVPEFPEDQFPKARSYNLGNVKAADGTPNPPEKWTFGALNPIFDHAKADLDLKAEGYSLYGHSAGAQFVHRFLLYQSDAKVLNAVAANAGWYTLPSGDETFPYGLKDSGVNGVMLDAFLAKPLTVLLGDKDTNPNHRSLRRTEEANRQGSHRFARGKTFYTVGKLVAEQRGVPFNWKIRSAPGIAHSNSGMAPYALPLLLGEGH